MENFEYTCETCAGEVCLNKLKSAGLQTISLEDKVKLIAKGRCVPGLALTQKKKNANRFFHKNLYTTYDWLTGCVHTNKLYCFPCILFDSLTKEKNTVWTSSGYSDLNNIHKAALTHSSTEKHLVSCLKFHSLVKCKVESSLNSQLEIELHNANVNRNRKIFNRIIDIVCFLGKQELDFNGHEESSSLYNKGNFLELVDVVDLFAKYDGLSETHIQLASGDSCLALSNKFQNDLISSVASVMYNEIKKEISETHFVAVIVDETPDVRGREQLVLILRYFRGSNIVDRFIKYIDVSVDQTAVTLSTCIINVLEEFNCLDKVIAQTYDGVVVMSSEVNEVQNIISHKCPLAKHVWCEAHVLNLILSKSFEQVSETKCFFSTVRSLVNFFHMSAERSAHYNGYALMSAETQWTYNSQTVNVIATQLDNLIGLFHNMGLNMDKWDGETLIQVSAFLYRLKEFEFNFFLNTFSEIFTESHILYEILQKNITDTVYCVQKIIEFETFMEQYRTKFDINYNCVLDTNCDRPENKTGIDNVKKNYRVFSEIIDRVLNVVRSRYKNLKQLKFFDLLACENYPSYCNHFPGESLVELMNMYGTIFNADILTNQLRCVYKTNQLKSYGVHDLIQYLHTYHLTSIFPEVYKLAKLIVTIPAGASTEQSFPCYKRIQTYLSKTQGQTRLADLSILAIEKELLVTLKRSANFYEDVLENYLTKERRDDLIYKH